MKRWQSVYALPLEVWVDIFSYPWISRQEFGQLVDKIGNRKFAEFMQFFLHDWGRRTLDEVFFRETGLYKYGGLYGTRRVYLDVPQAPLPENVKSFDGIQIHHFDAKTLDFLDKIRPLLANVALRFDISVNNFEDFRTILTNLTPFLAGIRSVHCRVRKPDNIDLNGGALVRANVNTIMDLLTQLGQDNTNSDGPRMCEVHLGFCEQLYGAIRQQFFNAETPRTFAVNFLAQSRAPGIGILNVQNRIGEELHGEWTEDVPVQVFQVTRHRANCNTGEVREWIRAMTKKQTHDSIQICNPTIGSLAAAQVDVQPVVEDEQAEQQQPCSSKESESQSPGVLELLQQLMAKLNNIEKEVGELREEVEKLEANQVQVPK